MESSARHPGNFLMNERLGLMRICPYNESHKVTERRFGIHLLKCRREYQARQILNGKRIDMLVCQYNNYHIVAAPELCHHEKHCPDSKTIRSHQLNVGPLLEHLDEDKLYDAQSFPPDPYEQNELFSGLHVGQIMGTYNFGKPQFISELKKMSVDDEEELRKSLRAKCHRKRKVNVKVDNPSEASGGQRKATTSLDEKKKENSEGAATSTSGTTDDDDEEEDWGKECKPGPGFDYMKNLWDPKSRFLHVPPGLTKSEKKLFMQIHGKNMEERRAKANSLAEARQRERERQLAIQWQEWEAGAQHEEQPGFRDEDFEYY